MALARRLGSVSPDTVGLEYSTIRRKGQTGSQRINGAVQPAVAVRKPGTTLPSEAVDHMPDIAKGHLPDHLDWII